jgi:DNA-binding response OmpR family regulator
MRVLLVEDESRLLGLVERTLRAEGYDVVGTGDGAHGFELARGGQFDLILLDVMLPNMSGLEITLRLRRLDVRTPILLLTARDAVEDRVAGLDAGADDYLVKPFAFDELLARVRALIRRHHEPSAGTELRVEDLTLDLLRREARRGTRVIELTARELALLEYLMRNAGQVLSRAQMIDRVWGPDFEGGENVVDTYIHYLRAKVDRGASSPLIRTVRGLGYALGR